MSSKSNMPDKKKKKRDPARRRKIAGAVIAIIIVLTMVLAIFEALFLNGGKPVQPQTEISLQDSRP